MDNTITSYIGAICEVKTTNNELLLFGTVKNVLVKDQVALEVVSKDGDPLQFIEYGLRVKVVLRKGGNFLVLGGTIYVSNKEFIRITNIEIFQNFERRKFFRVKTSANVNIQQADNVSIFESNGSSQMFNVNLLDISLSGLRFSSDLLLDIDEKLDIIDLHLTPDSPSFTFSSNVIDRFRVNDEFIYRCKITEISESDTDILCKSIFKLERENMKKRK